MVEEGIEELKELVRANIEITQETNRIVRKMRRTAFWGGILRIVWWLVIAGASGAAYYYYLQPYVEKIEQLYGITQQQSQGFNDQVTNFVKYFAQPHGSTTVQ